MPLFSLHLGSSPLTSSAIPDDAEVKRGFELLEENFTLSETNPLYVFVDPGVGGDVDAPGIQDPAAKLVEMLGSNDAFAPPFDIQANPAGDLLAITVPIAEANSEKGEAEAIRTLRTDIIPAAFRGGRR